MSKVDGEMRDHNLSQPITTVRNMYLVRSGGSGATNGDNGVPSKPVVLLMFLQAFSAFLFKRNFKNDENISTKRGFNRNRRGGRCNNNYKRSPGRSEF